MATVAESGLAVVCTPLDVFHFDMMSIQNVVCVLAGCYYLNFLNPPSCLLMNFMFMWREQAVAYLSAHR